MKIQSTISPIWFYWLLAMLVGLLAFYASMLVFPEIMKALFSLLIYSSTTAIDSEFSREAVQYMVLNHRVIGAIGVGHVSLLLMVLLGPFRRGLREGWYMLVVSLTMWLVAETFVSLATGFWQNAVVCITYGSGLTIPLIATFKNFKRPPT